MNIHYFDSTSEAYDKSQTGYTPADLDAAAYDAALAAFDIACQKHGFDSIEATVASKVVAAFSVQVEDGDILVVASEGVVGVLVGAWPVAVTHEHGAFHGIDWEQGAFHGITDWHDYEGGKYEESSRKAWELIEALHAAREAEERKLEVLSQQVEDEVCAIIISRLPAAERHNVAARIAHRFGWNVTEDDIHKAARELGISL